MKPPIHIVNSRRTSEGEYIGRGSPLGNPYSHLPDTKAQFRVKSRGESIRAYRGWLEAKIRERDAGVLAELRRLYRVALEDGELTLRCYCAPQPCHGEVIREFLERAFERLGV